MAEEEEDNYIEIEEDEEDGGEKEVWLFLINDNFNFRERDGYWSK